MNSRLTLCLATLALLLPASAVRAELVWIDPEDGGEVTTIKLTVTPAPAPDPAFKYRLTTRPIDEKPGNAVISYYRALLGEGKHFKEMVNKATQEFGEDRYESWISHSKVPLKDLPLEDVRKAITGFGQEFRHLEEASRCRECDWERGIENVRGTDVIMWLLPELSQLRMVSRMIALKTRLAIAENDFDETIELLRINYRMAQHAASDPFLVSQLVGVAIASIGNASLLELISAPDSPNMYWALTELPSPLINLRDSLRFELEIGQRIFPFLEDAETANHAPEEWQRLWTKAVNDLINLEGQPNAAREKIPAQLATLGLATLNYGHAKDSLIAWGFDPQQVEAMPVGQVLAIYSKRVYERIAQSYEKALLVPFTEAERFDDEADELIKQGHVLTGGPYREVIPIASLLLPAVSAARNAEVRLQREFAALRTIEALRMHAAENDGELPKKLSDITCVPVPENPVTGQPFVYYHEGKTAVLELPKSDGLHVAYRYEITIAP